MLYVNQEMVLRLGAVTGVGHARLILERFGKFWGAFSVIDLFLLNALTIVTEFIGITPGARLSGPAKVAGGAIAAVVVVARRVNRAISAGSSGSPWSWCSGSLLLVPIVLMAHPPLGQIAHDFLVPGLPGGAELST